MGLLFKHTNDLMLTVGIKQLSRGYVIITDAVAGLPVHLYMRTNITLTTTHEVETDLQMRKLGQGLPRGHPVG